MSVFYIGQRVRIVRPFRNQSFAGREATITERRDPCPFWPCGGFFATVDGLGVGNEWGPYWFLAESLEPVAPDGLESIEEINALYEPEPQVSTVKVVGEPITWFLPFDGGPPRIVRGQP